MNQQLILIMSPDKEKRGFVGQSTIKIEKEKVQESGESRRGRDGDQESKASGEGGLN